MRGRVGLRARTDFRVVSRTGSFRAQCRGIELSSSGIVLDRGHGAREVGLIQTLELYLPERRRPLRALARSVWCHGSQQALKFVSISDADRLSLAEHLDLQSRRGFPLN
jgi:hypothetical protein